MRVAALLLNTCLSLFTLVVLVTDGLPLDAYSVVLTVLLLLVPIISVLLLRAPPLANGVRSAAARISACLLNAVLLAAAAWASITRLPSHPSEPGLIPFVSLTLAAPLATLIVLLRASGPASTQTAISP